MYPSAVMLRSFTSHQASRSLVGWFSKTTPLFHSRLHRIYGPRFNSTSSNSTYGDLGNLGPALRSTRQVQRVGRGPGNNRGKTSGRGQKGQKARAKVKHWFEGGQTRITKLFPKVGFKSRREELQFVNLNMIQRLIDRGRLDPTKPITMRELYRTRYFGPLSNGVRILGGGASSLKQAIHISTSQATPGAIRRIEELGGTFTAQYYTPFSLKVLTRPEAALRKYGRIPLRARPTKRRHIEYYRSEERRGYLVDAPNPPTIKPKFVKRASVSPLLQKMKKLEKGGDPSATVVLGSQESWAASAKA
jgi:large subunit ribosomal protein L15